MMETPIIEASGLRKAYDGRTVVDGIDFQVPAGACFGILGPNGAGKSTTLRMIIGLTPVGGGTLRLFGLPMHPEQSAASRRMGVVPQEDNLDTDLTVRENLLVYSRYFGRSRAEIAALIPELLEFAQLTDRSDHPVRTLSGGMMRRLLIARALVGAPDLVVLDEPTTGLDPQARHLIWQRLRQLRERGVTLLLTTHYMEEAAQLCDHVLVMNHGRILDQDPPRTLIQRHVEPEVVEIRGGDASPPDPAAFRDLPGRMETVGDTLYFYTGDTCPVLQHLRKRKDLEYLLRPANLEDVFLKLTGRELRD